MSDEWVETTLGDVCSFISEKVDPATLPGETQYVGLEHITPRQPLLSSHGYASDVSSLVAAYTAGDTLFGRLRPYLHKVAIASEPGVCSPEILVLRANTELVDPGFLYLLASSDDAISHAVALSAGSRMPRTSVNDLASFEIRLPPLHVQRRIVDLLAHLDNHLANLQTEREALAAARNVALRLSLAGDFLNELGSEWRTSTLGEVAEIRGGGTPSTKEPDFWGGEIVWLTPTEVVKADGQKIGFSERSITQNGLDNSSAKLLPEGSVLVTTRASVGFVAIADKPMATNQGFQSLIPGDDVLSQFLLYWVQGNRNEFSMRASGSTFPEISKKKVASIPITYPSLAVQRRIVSVLSDMDEQVVALTKEFDGLSDLRSSLLSSLLSGAVEVNQNYDSLLSEVA